MNFTEKDRFLKSDIFCKKCDCGGIEDTQTCLKMIETTFEEDTVCIDFPKIEVGQTIIASILKHVLFYLSSTTVELKVAALGTLPYLSSHVLQFHSINITQIWSELGCDQNKDVRKKFSEIIGPTIKFCQVKFKSLFR